MTNRIQIDIIRDVEGNAGNVEGNSGNVEGCSGNVEGCSGNMESYSGMALTITSLLAGTMVYSQKNPRLLSDEDYYCLVIISLPALMASMFNGIR